MSNTLNCPVCNRPLSDHETVCPLCGFRFMNFIGGTREQAFEAQKDDAAIYRSNTFLPRFDLGVTCYHWKDKGGTIAVDTTERLSFGTAAQAENKTLWLDQEFARLSDEAPLTIEISVKQNDADERILRFQVTPLTEPRLQRLGLKLDSDLNLTLLLTNGSKTVESNRLPLLGG